MKTIFYILFIATIIVSMTDIVLGQPDKKPPQMGSGGTTIYVERNTPKVNEYQLKELKVSELYMPPIIISAPCQAYLCENTYVTPFPSQKEQLDKLNQQIKDKLGEISTKAGWVAFSGFTTFLSYTPSGYGGTSAEDQVRELRLLVQQLLQLQADREALTGDALKAAQDYVEKLKHIEVNQTTGTYSVKVSDANVHVNTPEEPKSQPTVGTHEEYKYSIEKVPVKAGFDQNGNPYYEMKWDVVKSTVTVPNDK